MMMLVDMADDAAHIVQLRWYVVELAFAVDVQHPALVIQTYAYPTIFHQEAWVAAVIKVLRQAEDGDFVFVRFTVPRTELSAVAAFVTVRVEVQRLETVLEAWDRNGDVGAVRADIHTLAANVVTFEAASGFLRDKRITIVTVHQRDRDIAFTLIDFRRIDVVPV